MKILRYLRRMVRGSKKKGKAGRRSGVKLEDCKTTKIIERLSDIPLDQVVNMAEIAKEMGCSRELVRQQAVKITTNTGREFILQKDVPRYCKECGKEKDKNLHSYHNPLPNTCYFCVQKRKAERELYWSFKYKLLACKICNKKDRRHVTEGICARCIYHHDPRFKARTKAATKNWRNRNLEEMKAKCKAYSKVWYQRKKAEDPDYFNRISREYYKDPKHREKQRLYQRERYYKRKQQQYGGTIDVPSNSKSSSSDSV